MKKNSQKISRGYRLKLSTHKLIKSLQELTENDSDFVINMSCRLFMQKITQVNFNKITEPAVLSQIETG
jgi:hypothetical protein